jgi:uncharacterized protein (TIGR00369 family)
MTWATDRLEALKSGTAVPPPVVETLRLGLLDDWGAGWVRKTWTPAPEVLGGDGSLFGGYLAALADQVLAFAAMSVTPDGMAFRTTNLHLDFVRVGRAHGLDILARVTAQTRRMITVRAEFRREDGELIAEAGAQQLLAPFGR